MHAWFHLMSQSFQDFSFSFPSIIHTLHRSARKEERQQHHWEEAQAVTCEVERNKGRLVAVDDIYRFLAQRVTGGSKGKRKNNVKINVLMHSVVPLCLLDWLVHRVIY